MDKITDERVELTPQDTYPPAEADATTPSENAPEDALPETALKRIVF